MKNAFSKKFQKNSKKKKKKKKKNSKKKKKKKEKNSKKKKKKKNSKKISQNFTVLNSNRATKFSTMNYTKYYQFISIQQTVLSKK